MVQQTLIKAIVEAAEAGSTIVDQLLSWAGGTDEGTFVGR
jgi:hypothetical protein